MTTPKPTPTQLPLPHFLNLPLPSIPTDPNSKTTNNQPSQHPLVFKLNLSPDQFEELLNLDAEIEEGEEGGLRLDFDRSGKAKLHLSPTRLLPLNPPRSGPSRTNKPEEIYCHTPASTPSSSHSPLTGLLKIPTSTPVYDLQRIPTSDHSSLSTNTRLADPIQPNPPVQHNPPPIKALRPTPELAQREKMAGQRLKEKRLEEDRKKKEKQMVVLPEGHSIAPVPKRTRQTKSKVPNKQQAPVPIKQQSAAASSNTISSSKLQSRPVPQPPPPRRALPGSQTGKHLAHVHNQHLSNPSIPPLKPVPSQTQPELSSLPPPLTAPAPPAVIFKPPNSSRRANPASVKQPTLPEPAVASPIESPNAPKLNPSVEPSSHSNEGEVDHQSTDTTSQTLKPPTPPLASLKSSPRPADALKNGSHVPSQIALPDPAGIPASDRPSSAASLGKRTSTKRAIESVNGKPTEYASQTERVESTADRDVTNSPSKRHRGDMLTPNINSVPPPSRPKKLPSREEPDRRAIQSNPDPKNTTGPSASSTHPPKTQDPPRKPPITVKKIPVTAPAERNVSNHIENGVNPPIVRKRGLESESTGGNSLTKRVRPEEGGTGLPTIRKMVRPAVVNGESSSAAQTTNGVIKKVKKKKKVKQPIDYTSSEVEEGEEPGEIVRSSGRARPPPPPAPAPDNTGTYANEAAEAPKPPPNNLVPSLPTPPEPVAEERSPPRPTHQAGTNPPERPPLPTIQKLPPPPTNTEDNIKNGNTAYHNSRLLFHKLSKHYEYVCLRLEEFKEDSRKMGSFQEVEELLVEAYGLEIELERVRNRIIRNYSQG